MRHGRKEEFIGGSAETEGGGTGNKKANRQIQRHRSRRDCGNEWEGKGILTNLNRYIKAIVDILIHKMLHQKYKDAANTWTDNIFALQSWCKTKFGISEQDLNKQFNIPEDLDYKE